MVKPFARKLLWTLLTPISISLVLASAVNKEMGAGLLFLFVAPVYLVTGLILVMFSVSRNETGKVLLLSSGIIQLLGGAICVFIYLRIYFHW